MSSMYAVIEVMAFDTWTAVVIGSSLLNTHWDLSGCLFGIDNYAHYEPLFPLRGFPDDISSETIVQLPERQDLTASSWFLFREIVNVDWNTEAVALDERIWESPDGTDEAGPPATKWLNSFELASVREQLDAHPGMILRCGGRVFRRGVARRRDALEGTNFPLLLEMMRVLAEQFGGDNVRMVVGFD